LVFIIVFHPIPMAQAKDDARLSISFQRPITITY
jgi:hypothetical protein